MKYCITQSVGYADYFAEFQKIVEWPYAIQKGETVRTDKDSVGERVDIVSHKLEDEIVWIDLEFSMLPKLEYFESKCQSMLESGFEIINGRTEEPQPA